MKGTVPFSPRAHASEVPALLLYGLGAIGLETARRLATPSAPPLVGVVDRHAEKVGRSLRDLLRDRGAPDLRVAVAAPAAPPGLHTPLDLPLRG